MKSLKRHVDEQFNPEWDYVVEMASIGYPVLNKTNHYIAVHGTNAGDRQHPHVHIYLRGDKRPFSKFNFEIALDEIFCYDEINLLRMTDQSKHINIKNRNICSWNGYHKLYEDFDNWLFSNNVEVRGGFINNLDAIIYFYNEESTNVHQQNPMLKYIKDHGMKILEKHKKYFSEEDVEKYKECFE